MGALAVNVGIPLPSLKTAGGEPSTLNIVAMDQQGLWTLQPQRRQERD